MSIWPRGLIHVATSPCGLMHVATCKYVTRPCGHLSESHVAKINHVDWGMWPHGHLVKCTWPHGHVEFGHMAICPPRGKIYVSSSPRVIMPHEIYIYSKKKETLKKIVQYNTTLFQLSSFRQISYKSTRTYIHNIYIYKC